MPPLNTAIPLAEVTVAVKTTVAPESAKSADELSVVLVDCFPGGGELTVWLKVLLLPR